MKQRVSSYPSLAVTQLTDLSAARQALVHLCQSIEFGQILNLQVRDRDPVFAPPPSLLLDIKLDSYSASRSESELADFALCDEVRCLFGRLDQLHTGRVQRIEVRAGIPRRVLIEAIFAEFTR